VKVGDVGIEIGVKRWISWILTFSSCYTSSHTHRLVWEVVCQKVRNKSLVRQTTLTERTCLQLAWNPRSRRSSYNHQLSSLQPQNPPLRANECRISSGSLIAGSTLLIFPCPSLAFTQPHRSHFQCFGSCNGARILGERQKKHSTAVCRRRVRKLMDVGFGWRAARRDG
jgi:hypothetical protein